MYVSAARCDDMKRARGFLLLLGRANCQQSTGIILTDLPADKKELHVCELHACHSLFSKIFLLQVLAPHELE